MPLEEIRRRFLDDGFVRLGKLATDEDLSRLRARADDLMLGRIDGAHLFFQHDALTGRYHDAPLAKGWQGPSLGYRKIEKLERDPVFAAWMRDPRFESIVGCFHSPPITLYRAMLMNKPARHGSDLPWHQDGGALWGIDREPTVQIWSALDAARIDTGCLHVVPGSHRGGLVTELGGVIASERVAAEDADARSVAIEVEAGEVVLLHCHLWHRSGGNRTDHPRRAFSVCYLDGRTRCRRRKRAPRQFETVWPSTAT